MADQTAVVIGAGVSGLATAALLGREGYDVTVVEKLDCVGGRSGEETIDGFRFDTGPSWYLMHDAFERFFKLFRKRTEDVLDLVDLNPAYRLFAENEEPIDVMSGRENVRDLFERLEPGAGDRVDEYLSSSAEVYELAVNHFLYTTFSSPTALLSPEIRAQYLTLLKQLTTSLERHVASRFSDVRLRQMLTYPAVFLSSHPARTPSMYHLMSHTDLEQGVKYPLGGFTAVVKALEELAREHGTTFRFGSAVKAITHSGSQATGVLVDSGEAIPADIVVSAADLHFTETQLLPPHLRTYDEKWFASRDPGLGTVLLMLGTDCQLPQLEHHNLLFSTHWEDDFAAVFDGPVESRPLNASRSIYVTKPSQSDPSTAPAGCENLFILVPVKASTTFGHGDLYREKASPSVTEVAEATIDQIEHWCRIEELRSHIVVKRTLGPSDFAERYNAWSGGSIGPAHTLRQSAFLRGHNTSNKLDDLFYAGATTVPGVGVPMCLISAENVIKRLRDDRSSKPLAEPA